MEDNHILSFGGLKLNTWDKTAEREGKQINLTAKEYSLLELFIKTPHKLLSREFIMERVWGINFDTGTNMVDVYVNYLRNKIQKGIYLIKNLSIRLSAWAISSKTIIH
jgi:two-component system copper resistance phosphate regulon response regulator CusR